MLWSTILAGILVGAQPQLPPGDHTRTVAVGARSRSYLLHMPPAAAAGKPLPLVIAYHGGGANPDSMQRFSRLSPKADAAGFIVVYPSGTGRLPRMLTFNAGACCGYALQEGVDDVAFAKAMLDDVASATPVDRKRVYATGMSNGAMMAYRIAAELSDRIAAIAPVAGPIGSEAIAPRHPVSVMHFHGTRDDFAPYAGSRGRRSLTQTSFISVAKSIETWVRANGCKGEPVKGREPDTASDGMTSTRTTYAACRGGAEVVLIEIDGGGHTWPGSEASLPVLGPTTSDLSATDMMWEFFKRHQRQ